MFQVSGGKVFIFGLCDPYDNSFLLWLFCDLELWLSEVKIMLLWGWVGSFTYLYYK